MKKEVIGMAQNYKEALRKVMKAPEYRSADVEKLKTILEIRNTKKERILKEDLKELMKSGEIVKIAGDKYDRPENLGMVLGEVVKANREYIFVRDDATNEEYFIPPGKTMQAFEGDKVLVAVNKASSIEDKDKREGVITAILHRENTRFVGTYKPRGEKVVVEISDRGNIRSLPVRKFEGAEGGQEVVVSLQTIDDKGVWVVERVLGDKNEPTTEIISLLYKYGVKTEFDLETLKEADEVDEIIPEEELYMRNDLRERMIVTIDGKDAKDLDDAVELRTDGEGNYVLGVHIADVSNYVTHKSALDAEAFERGTSVYLTDRVVPMIPPKLSNGVCSLNPDVDRLTISCEMTINSFGEVVSYDIFPSVINSKCRFTYQEVNSIIHKEEVNIEEKHKEFIPMLNAMNDLRLLLNEKRVRNGSINFETREAKIIVDKENKPLSIEVRERQEAEKLIEEFMLLANETVAKRFYEAGLPFIFRIHDVPKEDKVEQLSVLLGKLGLGDFYIENYEEPKEIQKILSSLEGHPSEETIKTLALRMMSKAIYSSEETGHFGLAKEYYTHFTSPIRRYPDLIVHRLIREFLIEHKTSKKTRDFWDKELIEIASHSSRKERRAMEAERELLEVKKIEFMADFVGENFEGVVAGLTDYGMYVELSNTVRGLVPIESLEGDYFFDEDAYCLRNRTTNETFSIGCRAHVKLMVANKESLKIEFSFLEKK